MSFAGLAGRKHEIPAVLAGWIGWQGALAHDALYIRASAYFLSLLLFMSGFAPLPHGLAINSSPFFIGVVRF